MTTLELARKLDQCLAAQVKLQKERDAAIEACELLAAWDQSNGDTELLSTACSTARAALARAQA